MGLTLEEARAKLAVLGFKHVARNAFDGTKHHCRREDGQNASVDLATGIVAIWGTRERFCLTGEMPEPDPPPVTVRRPPPEFRGCNLQVGLFSD